MSLSGSSMMGRATYWCLICESAWAGRTRETVRLLMGAVVRAEVVLARPTGRSSTRG